MSIMSQLNQINKYILEVKQIIEPKKLQKKKIKERVDLVRNKLEGEIPYIAGSNHSSKTYIHGSWKRKTQIRKSTDDRWDVDILAVIGSCVPPGNNTSNISPFVSPNSALQTIKRNLDNYYHKNKTRKDRPCITVEYQADNFDLEIMPVYYGNPKEYEYENVVVNIPNKNLDGWIRHFPFKFDAILSDFNQRYNKMLIPLIKLIKHWNNKKEKYLSGYHIELLTFYIFKEENPGDLSLFNFVKWWFEMAWSWIQKAQDEPQYIDVSDPYESFFDQKYYEDDRLREKLSELISQTLNDLKDDSSSVSQHFPKI